METQNLRFDKKFTLVFEPIGAPFSMSMSTTSWWPALAAQWSGVSPSLVLAAILAPLLIKRFTILIFPHFAATCMGVMLCWKIKSSFFSDNQQQNSTIHKSNYYIVRSDKYLMNPQMDTLGHRDPYYFFGSIIIFQRIFFRTKLIFS